MAARVPATARQSPGESQRVVAGSTAAARRERRRLQHQDLNRSQLLDAAEAHASSGIPTVVRNNAGESVIEEIAV